MPIKVTSARPRRRAFASPESVAPVSLPFKPEDVAGLRLLPAELARFLGVSKQTVSRWVKAGKVPIGHDGRIDPVAAVRGVVNSTDLDKLRARILRAAAEPVEEMRATLARQRAVIDGEPERRQALIAGTQQACASVTMDRLHRLCTAVSVRFDQASRVYADGGSEHLARWLDDVACEFFPDMDRFDRSGRVLPGSAVRGSYGSRSCASEAGKFQVNPDAQG